MEQDREYYTMIGKHFGYPDCCIDSFIKTRGAIGNKIGSQAGAQTGFIPCPSCGHKVLNLEVLLEDLIVDRKHSRPFPKVDMKEFNELFKSWQETQS